MNFYSEGAKIYSIDLLIAYVNHFKPKTGTLSLKTTTACDLLDNKIWPDPIRSNSKSKKGRTTYHSPNDTLDSPKKYPVDYIRIINADTKYPIIMMHGTGKNSKNSYIIDGYHRLANACIMEKRSIKTVHIDKKILQKSLVNSKGDHNAVATLQAHDIIALFIKRYIR